MPALRNKDTVEAKLVNAPEIDIAEKAKAIWQSWEKSRNNYGDMHAAIITYAERWARLMQVEINAGKKLEDVADSTSREAGNITGSMYGVAVSILVTVWKYSNQLHRWHNRKYGKSDDYEGIVNPSLIVISKV